MFTVKDIEQINNKGLTEESVNIQIENFKKGFPYLNLNRPATIGDGIVLLSETEQERYLKVFNEIDRTKLKFVPASGAASRMFKALYEFIANGKESDLDKNPEIKKFFSEIEFFAFVGDLDEELKGRGEELKALLASKSYKSILNALLDEDGLAYGTLPKGVLKFHKEDGEAKTAFEEHIIEGLEYAKSADGKVNLHFTVSPEHVEKFKSLQNEILEQYTKEGETVFEIAYSIQKPSTDMVSVDLDNELFRVEDGSLLFRPGGHGALLENLNDLNADIIFIKNIDNVVPDKLKAETIKYKKALGGLLHTLQTKAYSYLYKLDVPGFEEDYDLKEIENFIIQELGLSLPKDYESLEFHRKKICLNSILNRPFRICGMVKNEGEPGGGPFWVENRGGELRLQIVESSQIDMDNNTQVKIMKESSHFNPVDLVCGIKNYRGEKFDLLKFRDPETGFIAEKSKDGRKLKAQELPGLWNGAMADWVTIFVEVPLITFNPVKTVNDLLRKEHQG